MVSKNNFIWLNGCIIPWEKAKIHVMSHSLHYGSSVFEGIRCYSYHTGSVIFRHKEHVERLINSAKIYRIPVSWSVDDLMQANRDIVRKNNLVDAYIRSIIFIGDIGMEISPSSRYVSDIAIAAFFWQSYLGRDSIINGIKVMISSWNRVSANTIPNLAKAGGNYLSSMLISNEARRYGYQEGIGLDIYGYVAEGSGENVFVVKKSILFTPSCDSSILPGITRDTIIVLAKNMGLEVQERKLSREFLYLADEIFMSGTAAEIVPICSIDDVQVGDGIRGPITKKLQEAFFGLFSGKTEDKWNWLDLVN